MAERFAGTFEELKASLVKINGKWREPSEGHKQFAGPTGGFLNWYPSRGTLDFQGKPAEVAALREAVFAALNLGGLMASESAIETESQPAARRISEESEHASERNGLDDKIASAMAQSPVGSELIFGLVGAVGADLGKIRSALEDRLKQFGYTVTTIRLTEEVIRPIVGGPATESGEFQRLNEFMDAGNEARRKSADNAILAKGAAAVINQDRPGKPPERRAKHAYIISSLKHPAEVAELRKIYPLGFYLIGIHADEERRKSYLVDNKGIDKGDAEKLLARDENEPISHGQKVIDTFHLSDFFVRIDRGDVDRLEHSLWRLLDLIFADPFVTPTFDEYAMFLAFAASLRSADLSRQVGAVVAVDRQVVATGANDCPKFDGGLYWPEYVSRSEIGDVAGGRDHTLGYDSNKREQKRIIDDVLNRAGLKEPERSKVEEALKASRIRDLTEYGRMVHAEMEALLSCGRARVPMKGGTVYTTTFPCHNCAKHIVAAGIHRVVFIEPYQKSKAPEFHPDSIHVGFALSDTDGEVQSKVHFEPFVGVGPRRFFDLFSVQLGSGYPVVRKLSDGNKADWQRGVATPRLQMLPLSYLELEADACEQFLRGCKKIKEQGNG